MPSPLAESVAALAVQVEALARKRRRDRITSWVLAVVVFATIYVGYEQVQHGDRVACQARNATNATLLNLLENAYASAPAAPRKGATVEEVEEFEAQRARSAAFLVSTRRSLAPKGCPG